MQRQLQPVALAGPFIAPNLGAGVAVDHHDVQLPIAVQIHHRSAPRLGKACDPRLIPRLGKCAIAQAQQQVVGVFHREIWHGRHIALGHKQILHPVVVHILKLGVPSGRGAKIAAGIGPLRYGMAGKGDVFERGLFRPCCQHLQLAV